MFLLSNQNNFYIILSSYVEGHVQKNSSLNFMSLVGFQTCKIWMFFWKIFVDLFWKSFWGRNNSLEPPFLTVFNMVWKNQESCESWLVEFWVIRRLKMQANFYQQFILRFWAAIMDLPITLKYFFFSNTIPRRVSTCKILLF